MREGGRAAPFAAWERSLALRYLRAKRKDGGVALISIISFAGIALAVAVLIIVMSVMNGFRTELLSRMLGFNGHIFVQGPAVNRPDRAALITRLRQIPGVIEAIPVVEAQGVAIGPSQIAFTLVRGETPADVAGQSIVSHNLTSGSMKGFGEAEEGGDEVLVGRRLAETIGVRAGDLVTLISPSGGATVFGPSPPRRKDYRVAGLFSVGVSEYDQAYIYMPLPQAQLFFGRGALIDQIEIKIADPDRIDRLREAVQQTAGADAVVSDWRDRNHSFFNALQVERSVMRLILMMIVAIAAMNIISGLVMLVKNKSRDIAILRTMGASQGSIMRIFFLSGAAIGALGALAGLLLGALFCIYIDPIQSLVERITGVSVFSPDTYFLSRIPAKLEWSEVLGVVVYSLAVSFLCTAPPAWRASRLDPVEALRYE